MPKKVLALTLCSALCAALLTGCWGGSSDSPSALTSSAPSSASSSAPQSSAAQEPAPDPSAPGAPDSFADSSDASAGAPSGSAFVPSRAAASAAAQADTGWETRLVCPASPLPEGFTVRTVNIEGYENRPFDARAADALEAMLADAEAAGCKLYLVSGYRSTARQKALFERKVHAFTAEGFPRAEAEKQAAQWVARPGTSEHNLGLAADIVSADWYRSHSDLTADFERTPAFGWLCAHCAEYGFILRYPREKENITGVTYEPWHYRYVGREAAAAITARGITLEEYRELSA